MKPRPPQSIGFGLGRLHHVISRKQRERIVLGAYDAGIAHFDVAPAYGDGLCEAEAGRILKPHRSLVSLATKFGIPCTNSGERHRWLYFAQKGLRKAFSRNYGSEYSHRDFSGDAAIHNLENSLRRLSTDYVDYLFFHEPRHAQDCSDVRRALETMERLKEQGKVLHYGVSTNTAYFLDNGSDAIVGDTIQFELTQDSPSLVASLPEGVGSCAFGLMRFYSQGRREDRLDYTDVLARFFRDYPATMPIFASNRPAEIARLGRALNDMPRGAYGDDASYPDSIRPRLRA